MSRDLVRGIPSIERLRQRDTIRVLEDRYGHQAVVEALRDETDVLRRGLQAGDATATDSAASGLTERIEHAVAQRLESRFHASLRRVINATGVIVHTNLGRAPLAAAALEEVAAVAAGYSTLEYDLTAGHRGSRDHHVERWLTRLTGADAAIVVNNNAAATLLILSGLAAGREVIISRGELVEIGGGFRVPDVMAQSGAILREVGTTNRTRLADYGSAIGDRTALILRVHRSNFRIEGFTEQPDLAELVQLGRRFSVPVVDDLGSGCLDASLFEPGQVAGPTAVLRNEPTVRGSVDAGVEVVCFSGDKLLGGPQAGLIVGTQPRIEQLRGHPLMRALRIDKMTAAALVATLREYATGRAAANIPVLRMIAMPARAIEQRARALKDALKSSPTLRATITAGESTIGGGSAPGQTIPTTLLAVWIEGLGADALEARLRQLDPPVIARIDQDRVVLDLRTVFAEQDAVLARILLTL
jgi:L-seryl-tRNA(Ser) seleniumtransferase